MATVLNDVQLSEVMALDDARAVLAARLRRVMVPNNGDYTGRLANQMFNTTRAVASVKMEVCKRNDHWDTTLVALIVKFTDGHQLINRLSIKECVRMKMNTYELMRTSAYELLQFDDAACVELMLRYGDKK
jgi:hypothetical protein